MSGHYWVWIYDFEQNIWRKYIDSNVELNRNTDEVLATLNSNGEPYFLCYVRDEDKDEHVDVPRRRRSPPDTDADGDVAVSNNEPVADSKTLEDLPPHQRSHPHPCCHHRPPLKRLTRSSTPTASRARPMATGSLTYGRSRSRLSAYRLA